jgi:hypothetical protein
MGSVYADPEAPFTCVFSMLYYYTSSVIKVVLSLNIKVERATNLEMSTGSKPASRSFVL